MNPSSLHCPDPQQKGSLQAGMIMPNAKAVCVSQGDRGPLYPNKHKLAHTHDGREGEGKGDAE